MKINHIYNVTRRFIQCNKKVWNRAGYFYTFNQVYLYQFNLALL